MILDTSALIAILQKEPGSDALMDRMLQAATPRLSAGTLIEARMVAARIGGTAQLETLLETADVEVVSVDRRQAGLAFEGFRRFGKGRDPAALNYGDLFAYALARAFDEPLLCKGEDFGRTDVKLA
jgi:ribonuclease VapC